MAKKNILFAAFEASPFIKTGGLGDVSGALPVHLKNEEFDVRVILPLISSIPEEYKSKMKFVTSYEVPLGWRNQYCGLFTLMKGGVKYIRGTRRTRTEATWKKAIVTVKAGERIEQV